MSKTKIFIAVIAIAVIGIVAIILASSKFLVSPGVSEEKGGGTVSETNIPEGAPVSETKALEGISAEKSLPAVPKAETKEFQGVKYEIVGIGSSSDEINRAVYDIITGKLTEEQAKTLAEKIIKDITIKDSSFKEITLLFYSDKSSATAGKYDVAHVIWVPNEISVRMIE